MFKKKKGNSYKIAQRLQNRDTNAVSGVQMLQSILRVIHVFDSIFHPIWDR